MTTSLLYVSRSKLKIPEQAREVDAIVEVARSRNLRLEVTGALIFTVDHFAQILEGPAEAVAELMRSIEADPRHTDVDTVDVREVKGGQFTRWSMAYSGISTYVDQHIVALVECDGQKDREPKIKRLRRLMLELALASE